MPTATLACALFISTFGSICVPQAASMPGLLPASEAPAMTTSRPSDRVQKVSRGRWTWTGTLTGFGAGSVAWYVLVHPFQQDNGNPGTGGNPDGLTMRSSYTALAALAGVGASIGFAVDCVHAARQSIFIAPVSGPLGPPAVSTRGAGHDKGVRVGYRKRF